MSFVEGKEAYPYIAEFKKEPFKSFVFVKSKDIGSFYFGEYDRVLKIYLHFNENILVDKEVNIETVYWFLLLRKYLKQDIDEYKNEIFKFIKSCELEVVDEDQIGFKLSPHSPDISDIWSTYHALSCLKILGLLDQYLLLEGQNSIVRKIKNFTLAHKKHNGFLHCLSKDCRFKRTPSSYLTLYYVMEIFVLLGIDLRLYKNQFRAYIGDLKRDESIVYKLLCLKFLDMDAEVKEKTIQFIFQQQKINGGFSFNGEKGKIYDTFWIVSVLQGYSWEFDYNPVSIYSFINRKFSELLNRQLGWNINTLKLITQLTISLSLIWKKFIDQIERFLFKQLESNHYVDVSQVVKTFGFSSGFQDIVTFLNHCYQFHLDILDNRIEFERFIEPLSEGKKEVLREIFKQMQVKSVISLSEVFKQCKSSVQGDSIKLKDDIFPLLKEMELKNYYKGAIRTRRGLSFRTKHFLDLDYFLEIIVQADIEINVNLLYKEKSRLKDIKNDIYNMTLQLKRTSEEIREEIESYLLLDEIEYAKERLKFVLKNALMEADFLNENIENSFSEDFQYINFQSVLVNEISSWNKVYSALQKKLNETNRYLTEKITEREESVKLSKVIIELERRIIEIEDYLEKEFDAFKSYFVTTLEDGYDDDKYGLIIQAFSRISNYIDKYDIAIYQISQKIKSTEDKIVRKHKKVINNWIQFKEKTDDWIAYYKDGFEFFNRIQNTTSELKQSTENRLNLLAHTTNNKMSENMFQEAFKIIKDDSERVLNESLQQIKDLRTKVKNEIKRKQKLYLLYRYLHEKLDDLEENIVNLVASQVSSLKNDVLKVKSKSKIENFESFVASQIIKLKNDIETLQKRFDNNKNYKVDDVKNGFDKILSDFGVMNRKIDDKIVEFNKNADELENISYAIHQWKNFSKNFIYEVNDLKEEYIDDLISKEILNYTVKNQTCKVDIKSLSDILNVKCKILIPRINEMIEISKLQAEFKEVEKILILHTEQFYKIKELKSFMETELLKWNQEKIGKILALYDSSVRNKTLIVNTLELQNRINDLNNLDLELKELFNEKIRTLGLNESNKEIQEISNDLNSFIENTKLAIKNINSNLNRFNELISHIDKIYSELKIVQTNEFSLKPEEYSSWVKYQDMFNKIKAKHEEKLNQVQKGMEETFKTTFDKSKDMKSFESEVREFYVKRKQKLKDHYFEIIERINDEINTLKDESYGGDFIEFINLKEIHLSQQLGKLEAKVDDYIDYKEFKKAYVKVKKREASIEFQIKEIEKEVKLKIREYRKEINNFETKNKHVIEEFQKYIKEFREILVEKVKSAEELIIMTYVDMAIKAVSNQYLTLTFLQNELKIRKQKIQEHLISLISSGKLKGKYNPRIGLYYENPEILDKLDEKELEVIKKMNFRMYMFFRRLKNFTSQYGSIIAFFASILTISYYIFRLSGENPATITIPIVLILTLLVYLFRKRKKDNS